MMRRLLLVVLAISLVGIWTGSAAAGGVYSIRQQYNLDKAAEGFAVTQKGEPSNPRVFSDALIGRPLGLATTIVGTTLFIATLPFSIPSRSVRVAGRGLVKRPAGWTFKRGLGQNDPRFDEKGIFK